MHHRNPILRHMVPQDDEDDLVAICVNDMKHEKTGILRRKISNILSNHQYYLHVRYVQAERVELLVPRQKAQAIIQNLIKVGHSVGSDYSIAGMQVRRGESYEKQFQRRNAYCGHHALTQTLSRGNLGRRVTLLYKKKRTEVEDAFPLCLLQKG